MNSIDIEELHVNYIEEKRWQLPRFLARCAEAMADRSSFAKATADQPSPNLRLAQPVEALAKAGVADGA